MPAGKGGKEGGEGPIKYVLGLGVFDDDTWVNKAGAALPKLGVTIVSGAGSTNTGNGPRKEKPAPHDREGGDGKDADEAETSTGDAGQDDTLGESDELGSPAGDSRDFGVDAADMSGDSHSPGFGDIGT